MINRVLVTGAASMIGHATIDHLLLSGYSVLGITHFTPLNIEHKNLYKVVANLIDWGETYSAIGQFEPNYIIHLAGYNGNVAFNAEHPADIYFRTTQMALNVIRAALLTKTTKVVYPLASCSYPDNDLLLTENSDLKEVNLWANLPHSTVEPHGLAKRFITGYARQVAKQYGLACVGVCFNTVYGPHDSFELSKTKFVGAMIKKFVDAKVGNKRDVRLWGTGSPLRETIYVKDAAVALVKCMEGYSDSQEPINWGSGIDHSIKDYATLIKELSGFKGDVVWDATKSNGQNRKRFDTDKLMKFFGKPVFTPLDEGLTATIKFYYNNYVLETKP